MEQHSSGTQRLSDLPSETLPREKLIANGRSSLTDEELLAIFLRTGLKGCNVLELAARLKQAAGSLAALGAMEAGPIADLHKGIGKAKAATLAAVFELGRRAAREDVSRRRIQCAEDVYNLLVEELRYEAQETMLLLLLDARNMLIRHERIATGTLTRVMVHPRNVFGPALMANAAAVLLVHNHPSGNSAPSKTDVEFTRSMCAAAATLCLRLKDHVIIGAPTPERSKPYYSFAEEGQLPDFR